MNVVKIDRNLIQQSLSIPASYFIERGYSEDILIKYDIGLCLNPKKEMYNRAVAPIYDNEHKYMIGCTGRSIFDKCDQCEKYHATGTCPTDNLWKFSKWKHSSGFRADSILYNMWFAKEFIGKSYTAIIVEGPGNVWKLEEAGFHNSVAIFGSSLSDRQKINLDSSGAMSILILTDNDEAGHKAAEQIKSKCQNTYRVFRPTFTKSDIGEMNKEDIDKEIKPILSKLS